MNIFVLSNDIRLCAEYHCDKHVVKMILEHAQLLSSVHRMQGTEVGYELTHKNHPCAVWARTSQDNYEWLLELTICLGDEYYHRYGKKHKSMWSVVNTLPDPKLPKLGLTPHPKCVADNLKSIEDTVQAYRAYYLQDKARFCKWTSRDVPTWFQYPELSEQII